MYIAKNIWKMALFLSLS